MAREKKKILCPAGCGWGKTNWGDLRKHLAMSKDALHSNWRKKWGLPEQPVPLGGKGHKE